MFHRQLIHFGIGVYRKITKIKCTAIGDGVINCVEFCSADLSGLRKRIQVLVSVRRIAFKD